MNRKIYVATSSRADLGLLRELIIGLHSDEEVDFKLIVTGSHLSEKHGLTSTEIDFIPDSAQIKIDAFDENDSVLGIAKTIGSTVYQSADFFHSSKPDILVVLGDRFEILSVVIAAHLSGIPVAHIHGGEVSEGAIDESFRHSITKMSQVHFVAAEEYRNRVIQLGEDPKQVFLVGGMGADAISKLKIIPKEEIAESLKIKFKEKSLLITFHPVTLELDSSERQLAELLMALSELKETTLIFTMPNADTNNSSLRIMIDDFAYANENAFVFNSLGSQLYLSCMFHSDGVVGNSSSGLLEAPSMKKGSVNVGNRQRGRLAARSVIHCDAQKDSIRIALGRLFSADFRDGLESIENPYGVAGAAEKIHGVLKEITLDSLMKKKFYDKSPD